MIPQPAAQLNTCAVPGGEREWGELVDGLKTHSLMTVQQEDTWLPVATPVRARRTAFQADRFSLSADQYLSEPEKVPLKLEPSDQRHASEI